MKSEKGQTTQKNYIEEYTQRRVALCESPNYILSDTQRSKDDTNHARYRENRIPIERREYTSRGYFHNQDARSRKKNRNGEHVVLNEFQHKVALKAVTQM